MKKIAIASCLLFVCSISGAAFAQTKAVVIPLGSKSSGLQHYRIASQTWANTNGCETVSFTTNDSIVEAVLSSNFSILPTVNDQSWWSDIVYTTDDGATWSDVSEQVTVSGATTGVFTNNSENALLTLDPNTTYKFRIDLASPPSLSSGQCELFITFNKKDSGSVVTAAPASSPLQVPTGVGTRNSEE